MKFASSDARKATTDAICSASAACPAGMVAANASRAAPIGSVPGVRVGPGATAFTLIPAGPYSSVHALVSSSIAAFEAPYTAWPVRPKEATIVCAFGGEAPDVLELGEVGPHEPRRASARADRRDDLLSAGGVAPRDDHVRPVAGEAFCHGATDARCGARDERGPPCKPAHAALRGWLNLVVGRSWSTPSTSMSSFSL